MPKKSELSWSAVKLFAMDVDGVLTDGTVHKAGSAVIASGALDFYATGFTAPAASRRPT